MSARLARSALSAVALLACGPGRSAATPPRAAGPLSAKIAWRAPLHREHPLVGRIWEPSRQRFVGEHDVRDALHGHVLLGEKHDNPDHHALQARLLGAMTGANRRPVVAFEMLDVDDQGRVDEARRAAPRDAAAIARAVRWDESGWPPFAMYAPLVQTALDASLPIIATGLSRARTRAMTKGVGPAASEPIPLGAAEASSLRDELRDSHCGHLPERALEGMMRIQRARDATMAERLLGALAETGGADAVLVAGTGHTRRDRGVPRDLLARDAGRPVVSIAFAEVEPGRAEPDAYASSWHVGTLAGVFDFVWFTPRVTDDDPCAAFAK